MLIHQVLVSLLMWWSEKNSNTQLQTLLAHGDMTQQALLSDLLGLMDEASAIAREYYRKADELDVIKKGDSTPLTEADTALHHLITGHLRSMAIGLPVLSEESKSEEIAKRHAWKACWIIDPLDGTKEFVNRNGEFTVNIALIDGNQPTRTRRGARASERQNLHRL